MNFRARGRTRYTPGQMNKLEQEYALHLEMYKQAGEVHSYYFEPVNLRLAKGCFYKPDFMIFRPDGAMEFHDTKGHFENESKVRMKVVATTYPEFMFVVVRKRKKKDGGGFSYEEIQI